MRDGRTGVRIILTLPTACHGQKEIPDHERRFSAAYGDSLFARSAATARSYIPRRTAWTTRLSGTLPDLDYIAFVNNQFIAAGDRGTILTPPTECPGHTKLGATEPLSASPGQQPVCCRRVRHAILSSPDGAAGR